VALDSAGLPDGLFSNQNYQFGKILEVGKCCYILWPFKIFYGHLKYFTDIWDTL
jgi:hypothetical protein